MREEKLESIRKEIKKLTTARKKYIGRKKRMEKLAEDSKVQEYIRLQNQQEQSEKIIKSIEENASKEVEETIIRDYVFKKGIEKMPIEETNGVYVYQGIRPMGNRVYYKYHNLEKELPTFILEENNEEFKNNNIVIGIYEGYNDETKKAIYNHIQKEFFKKIEEEGQEKTKEYIKKTYECRIMK